jgi:isocitrate dehydrogenase kinase/phosphatase
MHILYFEVHVDIYTEITIQRHGYETKYRNFLRHENGNLIH